MSKLQSVILGWPPSTRVSPLYCLDKVPAESPDEFDFAGQHFVFFVGPVFPFDFVSCLGAFCRVWVGLGAFNIVVAASRDSDAKRIERWARSHSVRYEKWTVRSGKVLPEKIQFHSPNTVPANLRDELADLAAHKWAPAVHDAMAEYVPLMASALSRAAVVAPSDFLADLRLANNKVGQILRGSQATASQKVAMLTDLNAALSRCTSQVFSGSSPIIETECHFWAHSLLGTGVANIALARIRSFVENTIGKARIPERVASYAQIVNNVPDLQAELDAISWDQSFIDTNSALPKRKRDLFPLITYLSGRAVLQYNRDHLERAVDCAHIVHITEVESVHSNT